MQIVPFRSLGVVSFGDARQAARQKLNSEVTAFAKDVGETETDAFDALGLHLYYDDAGRLEFVEAFEPAEVTFRGVSFLGRNVASVIADMRAIGFEPTDGELGVAFPDAGIALTAPAGVVEGVAAHRKGYYD